MAKWSQFPDASAEVERLRVELEQARAHIKQEAEFLAIVMAAKHEVEKSVDGLQVKLEQARKQLRGMALDVLAASGQAQESYEAQRAAERRADRLEEQLADSEANVAHALCQMRLAKAERDDLAARLQSIQQAERKYTAAKLDEAAKMRKGQAI